MAQEQNDNSTGTERGSLTVSPGSSDPATMAMPVSAIEDQPVESLTSASSSGESSADDAGQEVKVKKER